MRTAFAGSLLLLVLSPGIVRASIEVLTRVGADFEHFGEVYRITDDQDTLTTINDWGTVVGLTIRSPQRAPSRFSVRGSAQLGQETQRFRLDFDGRLDTGSNRLEIVQETSWRAFRDGGDYSISSDHLDEHMLLTWERRVSEGTSLRLRHRLDGNWYSDPDEYNLNTWTNEPRADLRFRFREFDEARIGVRFAQRSVPDSASLGYRRVILETASNLLFGWTSSLDISNQVERRRYESDSIRESLWENRFDVRFEFGVGEHATLRVVHENQVTRYDHPDDLDFDSDWARTGVEVEIHKSSSLDFSLMPVYAFQLSGNAPEEEYTETGLELGMDLRIGNHTWIGITNEVGRRDYEVGAEASTDSDGAGLGDPAEDSFDTAFSDYVYNRLTILISSDVGQRIAVNLFVNWQPENHRVNRHDTDTRIISGGVDYRF